MTWLKLSQQSLWNRRFTTGLTIFSIALAVFLLLAIERVREGARTSFTNTISRTDLIVGARGGNISLLLYSVFHMGNATNNISMQSYREFSKHPAVAWTVPISLGDSHRGFRVVGTTEQFFTHYQFAGNAHLSFSEGQWSSSLFQVVVGAEVARKLGYRVGDKIVVAHGAGDVTIYSHDKTPFQISGILSATATPVDHSVFISLEALEAIHIGWESGVPGETLSEADLIKQFSEKKWEPTQITAFLVGAKSRIDTLRLSREINEYREEPLLAIVPALTLAELWQGVGFAETALRAVASVVLIVSIFGMLIAIYTSLNERRREFAILRSLGAGSRTVLGLILLETMACSAAGSLLGWILLQLGLIVILPLLKSMFGLQLAVALFSWTDMFYLLMVLILGGIAGLIAGLRAGRHTLSDGLQIRL